MSVSIPTQGTHFSDGVRTGAILNTQFVAGGNVLTPSLQVASANDTTPPGIFNTPKALHDVIPYPVAGSVIAAASSPAAAGYITLVTTSGPGITVQANFGGVTGPAGAAIIKLDTPRNLTVTSSGNDSAVNFTFFGWDQYGLPMTEQITGSNTATASGNKAFLYVQAVYTSAAVAAAVSVGVGNVFGLPYFCPAANYFGVPFWNNVPDPTIVTYNYPAPVSLANNPLADTMGANSVITVTVPSTAGMVNGDSVQITGATGFDGITAAQLNIVAPITVVSGTTFSYVSSGTGTSGSTGGGASVKYQLLVETAQPQGTVTVADQHTATATTGDVRGTYTPSTNADGIKRLTINFYAPAADYRRYTGSSNSASIILLTNALSTTNLSAVVNVLAPGHQLTGGELVTISGATTFNNISVGNLNLSNTPVTIVDQNNFTYVAGSAANNTGVGGGSAIVLTPSRGSLYQLPVGKFGVTQYHVALF